MLGLFLTFYFLSPAQAAFDQPVSWKDMEALNLQTILKTQYASPHHLLFSHIQWNDFLIALQDTEQRVDPEFKVPKELVPSVSFWLKIYTEYSSQQVVLCDKHHPELVYEVLDFRDLAQKARNQAAFEIMRQRQIRKTLHAYQVAFKNLNRKKRIKHRQLAPLEQNILSVLRESKHKYSFVVLAKNIKTQTGQRDNIMKGLLAAELFIPKMEQIFRAQGLSPDLVRLSLVESSFNLKAVSSAGAVGVWQFLKRSGDEYLIIDPKISIDERLSPLKSTLAAAKLLKRNHRILKTWPLAITSYNHGLKGLRTLANKKPRLGWASRNYYSEFLAVLRAEKYRHLFYGNSPELKQSTEVSFYQLKKSESALDLAYRFGISLQEFNLYNPDIKNLHKKLPKKFWIATPDIQKNNVDTFVRKHTVTLNRGF